MVADDGANSWKNVFVGGDAQSGGAGAPLDLVLAGDCEVGKVGDRANLVPDGSVTLDPEAAGEQEEGGSEKRGCFSFYGQISAGR